LTLIFKDFIRDDPRHPSHPRSIDAFFAANQLLNRLRN
jgi:hypothetical protein